MISSRVPLCARFLLLVSLMAIASLATAPAQAQLPGSSGGTTSPAEAVGRRHFERGQELYNKNRFLEAAKEFEAGYQALPRSAFLLNIGHSYRRAYELRKAKAAYELMLKVDPTTPHRPLVEDLVRTIDDALIAQETTVAPPPPAAATAAPPVSPPLALPGPIAPSSPQIDLSPPVVAESHQPGPARPRSLFRSPWFWGAVGAVVVTGVVGTVLLLNRDAGCRAQECFAAP